jgi:hypothetical protein
MKYKPRRDLSQFVREYKTLSPSELRTIILRERNEAVTPESITMWFKRNQSVYEELKKEVIEEMKPLEVVDESIFRNGTFEELETVKNWVKDMRRRHLSSQYMGRLLSQLKAVCKGQYPKLGIDLTQYGWSYKHPDRLDLDDCLQQLDLILEYHAKKDTFYIRRAMRDFLTSKGELLSEKRLVERNQTVMANLQVSS